MAMRNRSGDLAVAVELEDAGSVPLGGPVDHPPAAERERDRLRLRDPRRDHVGDGAGARSERRRQGDQHDLVDQGSHPDGRPATGAAVCANDREKRPDHEPTDDEQCARNGPRREEGCHASIQVLSVTALTATSVPHATRRTTGLERRSPARSPAPGARCRRPDTRGGFRVLPMTIPSNGARTGMRWSPIASPMKPRLSPFPTPPAQLDVQPQQPASRRPHPLRPHELRRRDLRRPLRLRRHPEVCPARDGLRGRRPGSRARRTAAARPLRTGGPSARRTWRRNGAEPSRVFEWRVTGRVERARERRGSPRSEGRLGSGGSCRCRDPRYAGRCHASNAPPRRA